MQESASSTLQQQEKQTDKQPLKTKQRLITDFLAATPTRGEQTLQETQIPSRNTGSQEAEDSTDKNQGKNKECVETHKETTKEINDAKTTAPPIQQEL